MHRQATLAMLCLLLWLLFASALVAARPPQAPPVRELHPVAETQPGKLWGSYDAALANFKANKRPLLVVLTASWCGPCQRLKREMQSHLDAGVFDGTDVVFLDVDRFRSTANQISGTTEFSIPFLALYVHRDGKPVREKVESGYTGRDQLRRFLWGL